MLRSVEGLKSVDIGQRRDAVRKACELGHALPPSWLHVLLPLLQDDDEAVCAGAAEALGNVGRRGGTSVHSILVVLHRMLTSQDIPARMRALQVIGRIGPNARLLIPALTAALRDTDLVLCRMAAEALTRIGPDAAEPLERLLDDPDVRVRREARWAFNKLNGRTVSERTSDTHVLDLKKTASRPRTIHPQRRDANRRNHPRHRSGREVYYRFLGDLGHELWWRAQIRDVSVSGLGLIFSRPTTTGARLTIDLHEAGVPIRLVARVAHCRRAEGAWSVGCSLSRPLTAAEIAALRDPSEK